MLMIPNNAFYVNLSCLIRSKDYIFWVYLAHHFIIYCLHSGWFLCLQLIFFISFLF